jgi:DNA-binding response OmpR family regulator
MSEPSLKRILIVDDDPLFAKALCDTLQGEGYWVETTSGGRAGIETFHAALDGANSFAAVITDLGMHEVDGRQVAAAVKKASPSTPVILLTGWGQWFESKENDPPPVDCIVAKPPKLRELREALTRCLESTKP